LSAKTLITHVALLRGINLGGKNKLPMKDLVAIFVAAGCTEVQTYIQSGNVVCKAPTKLTKELPPAIAAAIFERWGYRIPIVMRTADELRDVGRNNPFLKAGHEPDALHVAFLTEVPEPARVSALDPKRSPPDELVVRGRDIYLRLPNGVAPSKLTNAYFDATLRTTSTLRNWRTVLQLIEMARS
jgi:uncharacterized protein (DUF1697 family)